MACTSITLDNDDNKMNHFVMNKCKDTSNNCSCDEINISIYRRSRYKEEEERKRRWMDEGEERKERENERVLCNCKQSIVLTMTTLTSR